MLRIARGSSKFYDYLLLGLPKADRPALSLSNNQIKVNSSQQSSSANFQAVKGIVDDNARVAYLYLFAARQSIKVNMAFERNGKIVLWSFREWWKATQSQDKKPLDFYVDITEGGGSTHFPVIGEMLPDTMYSPTRYTEVYVASNSSANQIAAVIHHELRHVFLASLGRNVAAGSHPDPTVNAETLAAENEALANAKQ